jgi:excisionase family DNA binding protein
MLTIEEAARVMRIGRSAAYKLAREYLAADGASGIPVMRIGGQLRVPRHMLEEYIGGPITWPIPDAPVDDAPADEIAAGTAEPVNLAEPIHLTGRRATRRNGSQLALGLDA